MRKLTKRRQMLLYAISGMGINMLELSPKRIKVANMLPAVFLPIAYVPIAELIGKMMGGKKGGKKGKKPEAMGFEIGPEMMAMMGGFTVLRLFTLMGGMADIKFTKEELLGLNAKLNKIKKPKKK